MAVIPYLMKTSFIATALRLAGPDYKEPVFRQCSQCKAFQFYDTDPVKDLWFKDLQKEITWLKNVNRGFREYGISISHTYCPPCGGRTRLEFQESRGQWK